MKRLFVVPFIAMALVYAIVARWTPVQGDGWLHLVWAGRHASGWLAAHYQFSDAIGYVLARFPAVHVLLSPMVAIALVVGMFCVVVRRTPRAGSGDLLALGLLSAMIWIGQPHAGVAWFYTPSVAMHVWGGAAAVWFVAALRCQWRITPLLIVLGYCAGTSTRSIAVATLIISFAERPRPRFAMCALIAGTIVGFARPPFLEVGKVFRRGLDPNLFVLKLPIEEIGRIVALVGVFAIVELARRALERGRLNDVEQPRGTAYGVVLYFVITLLCIFGPKYYEATLFPATIIIACTALPWLLWFADARGYRIALATFAIAVHLIAWTAALVTYHRLGGEGAVRDALFAHAPKGGVAKAPPYSQILPSFFWFGEDLSTPRMRQMVALDVYGLKDIELEPVFRRLELDPHIGLSLGKDAWSTTPSVARDQFELRHAKGELAVTNVKFAELGSRKLLLAWDAGGEHVNPRTAISSLDEENQYTIKLYSELKRFDEAYVVVGNVATKMPYRNGSLKVRPTAPVMQALVVCNAKVCLLADAFVPRF
ncbi:MAG: hypothetical protein QM831_16130 [Kofleriaceae bacterium]